MGGRTVLINSSLSNTTTYHMSMFLMPLTTIKRMGKVRRKFFWQGEQLKKKYHLVKWDKICKSKRKGGLGMKKLRRMNISLLCKWWWMLEKEEGLWQEIVRKKYIRQSPICLIKERMSDSPIWKDLLKVRQIYLQGRKYKINNEKSVSFWLDKWLDDKPLCVAYPILFDLCADKRISVHEMWSEGWVIHFQIIPQGLARSQWYELAERLNNVSLNDGKDIPLWRWTASKVFSVKSVYNHLTKHESGADYNRIWKAKILEKIRIFMWLLEQKAVLTKDNMIRRNWQGSPACYFCGEPERNDHLFFSCPIAKVVWGVVAKCFQQSTRPLCYEQYWQWIKRALPGGEHICDGCSCYLLGYLEG
jgi:hypothetical protein